MEPHAATFPADEYRGMIEQDGERARRELRALVEREPDSVAAWSMLAEAYRRCLDFAASADATRALLALEPQNLAGLRSMALCQHGLGDVEGALRAYQTAFKITGSTECAAVSPVLLHRLGRLEEAERDFAFLLAQAPLDNVNVLAGLRGMMSVLRDVGRPLAADHYAHDLVRRFNRLPFTVASFLIQRDNATSFHGWYSLADKSQLNAVLRRGIAVDPNGVRAPAAFALPEDRAELAAYAVAAEPEALYVVKPIRGSGGQGIAVLAEVTDVIDRTDVVVQRYIDRPYLVDGRKGHLRVYCLVTASDPLRAYVYRDGIVRFAPEPYDPRPERLGEIAMHVTNTALHMGHPGLRISDDADKDDDGSVWSLAGLLRRVTAAGQDGEATFGKISDLAASFVRLLQRDGFFARQAALGSQRSYGPKLVGFDILLDADTNPWLIEIQAAPATVGSALVNKVNRELYETVFRMTVGTLIEDGMNAEQIQAILRDADALAGREAEIEMLNRGKFERLPI